MKEFKDYKKQFDDLMKDMESNTNSSEARIKLPEAIAGIQYYYTHASYKLAKGALSISILAIIISIITSLQIPTRLSFSHLIDVKEKMAFEGIINNYIQRIKSKDDFPFMFEFDYWVGALINNEIDVYVYVRPPVSIIDERYPIVKKEVEKQFNKLKEEIISGIRKTILEWAEFSKYKDSKINVVLRIEEKTSTQRLGAYLENIK